MTSGAGRLAFCAVLLGAAGLLCAGMSQATAASRLCRQFEAELAGLGHGVRASPARIRKYDSAIARQNEEIAKARGRARQAGCGFSLFGSNVAACATLNASLQRMSANIDSLRTQRAKLARGDIPQERARIKAALDTNDCRGASRSGKRSIEARRMQPELVDQFADDRQPYAGGIDAEPAEDGYLAPLIDLSLERAPHPQGEFRTMCVRTCDGYFFPMSNAATLRDFERDQKNCESSCPNTEMQVFYMRGIGGDPATMISSVDGRPYREMRTAFLYKKPTPVGAPACGCNAARGYQVIGSGSVAAPAYSHPESASIVSFGPPPAATDRTSGAATGTEAGKKESVEAPALPLPADRKVRVVAPAFLPDPEGAIDLQAPAPKPGP